ncbi:MAG: hypothetical protein EPO42_02630 [Gallionellaceae bacterium]|nr:MAG: hypothetical protein EPO42_02630 [Gallionellaceae bacterium]
MLDLPLEPTDDLAQPAFKDGASCETWLHQLQLTNLHQAHGVLRAQLDELNRYPMRGLERLHTLELLRETIVLVQGDYAKKLISKKLPLSDDELTVFVSIIGLWQGMVNGYQRCLQAYVAGDKQLAGSGALLVQRCLRYSGQQIFEHLRSGYEFDSHLWHQLHALFAFAEEQGFHQAEVDDELHSPGHPNSCQATYAKTLLACHAHPSELTRGQLQLLDRWLTLWSGTLTIDRRCGASKDDAPPLAVDLGKAQGLQAIRYITPSDSLRYLPMVPLSKLLRVKTILLQQGQSPQQLELGSECNSADCVEFLNKLHHYCCEETGERLADRHTIAQSAQLCFGIEGIYAHIAHKPFKQPGKEVGMDTLARKQIAAFGHVLSDTNRHNISQLGFGLETWQIENESILGVRLLREANQGERIGAHQLVAVKPDDAKAFMLGKTSWVVVTRGGQLRMGIQYMPGMAQPISIKGKGINAALSDKAAAALLLPEVAAFKTPPSLIVQRDFFRPDRLADIVHPDDRIQALKLGFSVDKGSDYERVSFTPV